MHDVPFDRDNLIPDFAKLNLRYREYTPDTANINFILLFSEMFLENINYYYLNLLFPFGMQNGNI